MPLYYFRIIRGRKVSFTEKDSPDLFRAAADIQRANPGATVSPCTEFQYMQHIDETTNRKGKALHDALFSRKKRSAE